MPFRACLTLFFLFLCVSLFQFSVWSLGVACPPAQGYFLEHTLSLKTCSDQQPLVEQQQELVAAQQQQQEYNRAAQIALRAIRETEASHAHGSSGQQQFNQGSAEGALTSTLIALVFLTRVSSNIGQEQEGAAADAAKTNIVCV